MVDSNSKPPEGGRPAVFAGADAEPTPAPGIGRPPNTAKKPGGATGAGWMPGQSGNPGGRIKVGHIRELAREKTEEALDALLWVVNLRSVKQARAIAAAADALLSRGWGQPVQQVEVSTVDLTALSDEEFEQLKALYARITQPASAPTVALAKPAQPRGH